MCTAYTNLANAFLISFPLKKQRSIVDAWGLNHQNDIYFVKINFVPFHLIYS